MQQEAPTAIEPSERGPVLGGWRREVPGRCRALAKRFENLETQPTYDGQRHRDLGPLSVVDFTEEEVPLPPGVEPSSKKDVTLPEPYAQFDEEVDLWAEELM